MWLYFSGLAELSWCLSSPLTYTGGVFILIYISGCWYLLEKSSWDLVTTWCPSAGCRVSLEYGYKLPTLVCVELPVLPPDGADLEHVPHPVPRILHLLGCLVCTSCTIVHDDRVGPHGQAGVSCQGGHCHQVGV